MSPEFVRTDCIDAKKDSNHRVNFLWDLATVVTHIQATSNTRVHVHTLSDDGAMTCMRGSDVYAVRMQYERSCKANFCTLHTTLVVWDGERKYDGVRTTLVHFTCEHFTR